MAFKGDICMSESKTRDRLTLTTAQQAEDKAFWLNKLSGDWQKTVFPYDFFSRSGAAALANDTQSNGDFRLSGANFESLMALCGYSDIKLHIVLLTAVLVLLKKYSGRTDMIVATPIYRQETEGEFINTVLPLRYRLEDRLTFRQAIVGIRLTLLEAVAHQNFPVETLPDLMGRRVTGDGFPLFDVMVLLRNIHRRDYISHIPVSMTFCFDRGGDGLRAAVEHRSQLFRPQTVRRIANHLLRVLERGLARELDIPVADFDILSAPERRQLLEDWNDTALAYPREKSIDSLFKAQVDRTGDHVAVVGRSEGAGWCQLSYRQLDEGARRWARRLIEKGVGPDTIVAILMERSVELTIALLGVIKAGAAYLPIDPDYPAERIRFILQDSGSSIVLTDHSDRLPSTVDRHPSPSSRRPVTSLAYVIYTSGSTGLPRGVLIRQAGLVNLVYTYHRIFGKDNRNRMSQVSSPGFDAMAFETWPCLLSGAALNIAGDDVRTDPARMRRWLIREGISHSFQPTVMAELLLKEEWPKQGVALKILQAAGDRLNHYPLHAYPFRFFNLYGPTECTVWTTWAEVSVHPESDADCFSAYPPIGKPVANHRVYILGADLRPVPIGTAGELCIGGDGLARGYLNNPELTAEKFVDLAAKIREDTRNSTRQILSPKSYILNPKSQIHYRTGDLARWRPDGRIDFLGRLDFQVKIRGFRIEVGEIEAWLLKHDALKTAVVMAREDEGNEKYLSAYIVPHPPPTNKTSPTSLTHELRQYLSLHLPDYMIPSHFIVMENLPLTANGKVDRAALPHSREAEGEIPVPLSGEVEEKLAVIWQKALGVTKKGIGAETNFFELGGHSLKAALMLAEVHKELQVQVPLADFLEYPVIRKLAAVVKKGEVSQLAPLEKAEEKEYYPVIPAQRRLYVLQQLEPGSTGYNTPLTMWVAGEIDTVRLEKTFKQIIGRYESFRTSYRMVAGEPVQQVHEEVRLEVEYYDVRESGSSPDPLVRDFIRPFDLSRPPLLRVGVIGVGEGKYVLMVDIHHIAADGLSMAILVKEFTALYGGADLPQPPFQYRDYAVRVCRRDGAQTEALAKQEAYWLSEFSDQTPVLNLPVDFARPPQQSFDGGIVSFYLDQAEASALKALAASSGATLYVVLLTIYNVFLARLADQEDIVIGSDTAGRRHADSRFIIGMFVNTLALRNFLRHHQTFSTFLKEVKARTYRAFENQDYPFEELVEKVAVSRDASRNPLYDVMFSLNNIDIIPPESPAWKSSYLNLSPYAARHTTAKFDLTLNAAEVDDRIRMVFEYCIRLFKQETIQRFVYYFKAIVTMVLQDGDVRLGEIEILSPSEKRQILFEFNNSRQDIPRNRCYHRLFSDRAARHPLRLAAVYRDLHISYHALNRQANRLAHFLVQRCPGPGTMVALYLERGITMLAAMIGVFKAAAVYLPLETDYPPERIRYILQNSEARLLMAQQDQAVPIHSQRNSLPRLQEIVDPTLLIEAEGLAAYPDHDPAVRVGSHDLAYMIYTSGTTGTPKGVMIHHLAMLNHLLAKIHDLAIGAGDVIAQTASACFDISIWQFLAAPMTGARALVVERQTVLQPLLLLELLQKTQVTILESVPSLMTAFLEAAAGERDKELTSLRWMVPTGEALSPALVTEWYRLYPRIKLMNAYGPTEAADDVTHYVVRRPPHRYLKTVPIGRPLHNLHIYILSRGFSLCPVGVRGEICVAGIGVGKGYWKEPEKTRQAFIVNPYLKEIGDQDYAVVYRTGDVGYFREDGTLECLGRLDFQVKIRGYRIELGEIENHLLEHPHVKEAVVLAREDKGVEKYLTAYIVPHPPPPTSPTNQTSPAKLRQYLAETLPDYMIPAYFVILTFLPLASSGKIDRRALPQPEVDEPGHRLTPPRDEIEEKLLAIWSEVLEIEGQKIGVEHDFFRLGGHSLKAISLANAIHRTFDVKVSIQDIFGASTIAALAAVIRRDEPTPFKHIPCRELREYYDLSYAQKRLWILQRRDPHSQAFNMPQKVTLPEAVDELMIRTVLSRLTARHESFRTCFPEVEGEVVQVVRPVVEVNLQVIDLTHLPAETRQRERQKLLQQESFFPFQLERPPLLRARLLKCGPQEYDLILTMHHLIADGWSLDVLEREFAALYRLLKRGEAAEPAPLKLQYRDYADWHTQLLANREQMERAAAFWRGYLDGDLPVLQLPYNVSPGELRSKKGAAYRLVVTGAVTRALREMAIQHNASLFMVLLAVFNMLLSQLRGQADIVIGMPGVARQHDDLKQIVGLFVNPLVIRTHVDRDESFRDFLSRVQKDTLNVLEYQGYPLELIFEALGVKYPKISVFFNMLNTGSQEREELKDTASCHIARLQDAKFELELYLTEYRNGIEIFCVYFSELFHPPMIEEIMGMYVSLLEQVTADADKPIGAFRRQGGGRKLRRSRLDRP